MGKEALLTVVIPVFNGEAVIENTVSQIEKSVYANLEILLVDDGSTDASKEVCMSLQEKDSRVRCIHKENGGIASARNQGLAAARGEYICFCDQDDETEPSMYRTLLDRMKEGCAEIGMCSTGRVIKGRKSIYEQLQDGSYEGEEILQRLLYPLLFRGFSYPFVQDGNYLYGTLWKCIFKRELLERKEITFRSFVHFEDDWLFVTQALAAAKKVITVRKIGYYWVIRETSRSHARLFIEDMPKRLQALDDWEDSYLDKGRIPEDILEEYRRVRWCEHYIWLLENGLPPRNRGSRKTYRKTVRAFITESDYRRQLQAVTLLKGSAFKRKLVLKSLYYGGVRTAFCVNAIVQSCIHLAEKNAVLVKLERKGKLKQKESER